MKAITRATNQTSSWSARDAFSFLKTEVSKSNNGMAVPIADSDETFTAAAAIGGGGEE